MVTTHDQAERAGNDAVSNAKARRLTPGGALYELKAKAPKGREASWDDVHIAAAVLWLGLI